MEKGALRGRDRTRRIAIDFGRKLAEVDVEALEPSRGHDRTLHLLSCFFLVEIESSSQMNSANPTAESSSCDLLDEMASRRMRRSLKTGGSIQAVRVSEARRSRREYVNSASMEMAFFLCTHCSFLTGSGSPNEGKGVAPFRDPPSIAAYLLQRSRII